MSTLGKLNWSDALHGLIVAVATSVLTLLMQMLSSGQIDWRQLGLATLSSIVAYGLKVVSSDESGKILGKV